MSQFVAPWQFERRRRGIFVEDKSGVISSPVKGGIFRLGTARMRLDRKSAARGSASKAINHKCTYAGLPLLLLH
jgi:hypothetical protein